MRSTALSPDGEDGVGGISTPIPSIFCELRESDFELSRDKSLFLPLMFTSCIALDEFEVELAE